MIQIKNSELKPILTALDNITQRCRFYPSLALKIIKIKKRIKEQLDDILDACKITDPEFTNYVRDYTNIILKYCKKDEFNNPVRTESGIFIFETPESYEQFSKEMEELDASNPNGAKLNREQEKKLQELLEQYFTIQEDPINADLLGDNIIPISELEILYNSGIIIQEEENKDISTNDTKS